MFGDQFYNRRANDNAIGNARDTGGLFGGSDAKADGDRQISMCLKACYSVINARLCGDLQACDASDADII
jgi:hypothetical protein